MIETAQAARPRVSVSSVVVGFEHMRQAVRKIIEELGGEPVLINEDLAASPNSPRNVCLDGVDSSDIVISIPGERCEFRAPSGKLVIEEEYEWALRAKKLVLVFLQDVERDHDAVAFDSTLSDYEDGRFRALINDTKDLQQQINKALGPQLEVLERQPVKEEDVRTRLLQLPQVDQHSAVLRFVIAPEREEEVIDPLQLDARSFHKRIMEIAHEIDLFDYSEAKCATMQEEGLSIAQGFDEYGSQRTENWRQVMISELGWITVDANIDPRADHRTPLSGMTIVEADIRNRVETVFRFVSRLFDELDRNRRHVTFLYDVAFGNVKSKVLVPDHTPRSTLSMGLGQDDTIILFKKPKRVVRNDFIDHANEGERMLLACRRTFKSGLD